MPATVSGNPRNFKPDFNVGFRFDDAAFLPLSLDAKNAMVDQSAVRISRYLDFLDPEDIPPPAVFLPDMKELALNLDIAFNRNYGAPEPYFTMMVTFVDDTSQVDGMPKGQVKARIQVLVDDIVAEIALIESEESLPVTATIDYLT